MSGQFLYKQLYLPEHPNASSTGLVYEHILIAEKTLGRYLKKGESVHHIDGNKKNNTPENLIVFASNADHVRFHKSESPNLVKIGDTWQCKNIQQVKICEWCHKEYIAGKNNKRKLQKYCSHECAANAHKVCSLSPSDIQQLLFENNGNFTKTAFGLNVTANALVKILKINNLPYHSKDYKTIR